MESIIEFISKQEDGATEQSLCAQFPNLTKTQIASALNSLLQQNQIEVTKKGNSIVYRILENKTQGYEAMIISLIAQSGSSGLWLKDIKTKTNIPHNLVLKILKILEDTRKIKSIRSLKNNKKTYVLYDIKPDEDVSGGVWFSNNDVDLVFVNKLMDIIHQFVAKEETAFTLNRIDSLIRLRTIKEFITKSEISEVDLSMEDINTLIDCLVYDGRLEKIETEDGIALRALKNDFLKL